MKLKLAFVAALALVMTGCVGKVVPQTKITGSIGGKPFAVVTPKDSDLEGFEVRAETNGTITVKLDKLTAKMNPENITNTGAAQAAIINATAEAVSKATEAGLKAAAGAAK